MKQQVSQWIKMTNYAFKLHVEQLPFPKSLMAFDVGLKSTGVAITSSDMKHAFVWNELFVVSDNSQRRAQVSRFSGEGYEANNKREASWFGDWKA